MKSGWIDRLNIFIRADKYTMTAFLISLIFAIIFSIFSVIQYYSLGVSAYDLGINAQELWGFIHTGSFYTPLLNENLLIEHFTIFKFVQIPLYYLFPSPITLMIFEDIFIALAGYIVYLIAIEILKNRISSKRILFVISLILLFSYEMSPYVQSLVSFPFHNMAFLPFFFLLAFYSFLTEKRALQLISILFIISLHANFVYIVAILIVYEFFYLHTENGKKIKTWIYKNSRAGGVRDFIIMVIFIALLYGYLVLAGIVKLHLAGISSYSLIPSTGEVGTSITSPIILLKILVTDPRKLLNIISINRASKTFFLNLMFKSTGYLPLFSPLSLIMDIPYILYALPSSYTSYYQLGYQYSAMIIGAIYISAIIGLNNILRLYEFINRKYGKQGYKLMVPKKAKKPMTAVVFFIIIVIMIATVLPYGLMAPVQIENTPSREQMNDIFTEHISGAPEYLKHISNSMPQNSYILTENSLMPYFSNHLHIYVASSLPGYYNNLSKFQYIIIQNNSFWATYGGSHSLQTITDNVIANGSFTVIGTYKAEGIIELENSSMEH